MKKQNKAQNNEQSKVFSARSISTKLAKDCEIGESIKIAGIVKRVEIVTTQFGQQPKFLGDFVAEFRGQKFAARKAYLPAAAAELLEGADLDEGQARFCFIISKVASDKTKQGYAWSVEVPLAPEVTASPALELLEYSN
jgi:hypothetical protein